MNQAAEKQGGLRSKHLLTALSFAVSLGCLGLFVHQCEQQGVLRIRFDAEPWAVLLGSSVFLLELVLRALRWKLLLQPVAAQRFAADGTEATSLHAAPSDNHTDQTTRPALTDASGSTPLRLGPLVVITFISFGVSNLLLARSGELVRPFMASRRFGLPFLPVVATAMMERIFDLVGLLAVFVLMTFTLPTELGAGISPMFLVMLDRAGRLGSVLGVVGLGLFFFLAAQEQVARALVQRVSTWLPTRIQAPVMKLYDGLSAGLAACRSWTIPLLVLILSLAIWLNGTFALLVMFRGFGFELPLAAACFLQVSLALAVIPPQAPGFVGVWQLAISQALMAWGVAPELAASFAVIFWLMSFGPVSLIGILCLWRYGFDLRRLSQEASALYRKLGAPGTVSESTST